jgi:serine/threonine-protein kinase RsbW
VIKLPSSDKSPIPKKAQLRVTAGLSGLDQVLLWFSQLHESFIPSSVWLRCSLALAEGFTNVVRHAHKDKAPDFPVDLEVTMFSEHLEIRVWDEGPPFDLEKKIRDIQEATDPFSGGGRGLKLMRDIADELSYTRLPDQRNCLLIVKYYEVKTRA